MKIFSFKNSFPTRLSFQIISVVSGLLIFSLIVVALYSYSLIGDEATKSANNALDAAISDIETVLAKVETATKDAADLALEHMDDETYLYHITEMMVRNHSSIKGSAIAFAPEYFKGRHFFSPYSSIDPVSGMLYQTQLGKEKYDYFEMEWYKIPSLLGVSGWSEPYYDEGGGEFLMSTFSYPILDESGNVIAVVTADISVDWISELISKIKPYPSAHVVLVSKKGAYVAAEHLERFNGYDLFTSVARYKDKRATAIADAMISGKDTTMRFHDGENLSFAVVGPLFNGWSALIVCQYKDVLSRAIRMVTILSIIGLLALLVIFFYCLSTIRKQTRPLLEFTESAKSISAGNFDTALPEIKTEDEIKMLHDSFDHMQKSIKQYIEDLQNTMSAKERIESELNIARAIQMGMLPKPLQADSRVDLFAKVIPAKEVGGDLYDYAVRGDYLYLSIGDVSGKGVPASLVMAITLSAFRFVSGLHLEMDEIVTQVNNAVAGGNDTGMFVTLFVAKINLKTGHMIFCNAGHNPVLLQTPDGQTRFLDEKSNLAIGLLPEFKFESQEIDLPAGSHLLLYTDGVTEAERADKAQYGNDRLIEWAQSVSPSMTAEEAGTSLLDSVHKFTEGAEQNDDITMMTIKLGSGA